MTYFSWGYDDFADITFSSVFFLLFLVYKCNAISGCLMKQWRCAAVVGRCSGMGHRTLVAGHPIICSLSILVFPQPFSPSHFTIMDRVQAFGKTFR